MNENVDSWIKNQPRVPYNELPQNVVPMIDKGTFQAGSAPAWENPKAKDSSGLPT